MSQDGFPISVTLKGGKDYDAPWIVIYGHSPDEVEQKLDAVITQNLAAKTVEAAAFFRAQHNAVPLTSPQQATQAPQTAQQPPAGPWGGQAPQAPQQATQGQPQGGPQNGAPHPAGQVCVQCGTVLQYKAGISKNNNAYKMWACPNGRSRNDGHESVFIR